MKTLKHIIMIALIGGMMMSLWGCTNKKYKVDYCGSKEMYRGAEDSYAAKERVVLKYDLIATDTNYSFYLDEEPVDYDYDDGCFTISFIMPDHDVKLEVISNNTMIYIPGINITLTNQIAPADIWILKDSEENRKMTIWGKATIANGEYELGQKSELTISKEETYIIRMIDDDKYYYSSPNITLNDGYKIIIKETGIMEAIVEVYDENDLLINEHEMFVARL